MNYTALISAAIGALTAAIPLFLFIASKTKTTVDDQIAAALVRILGVDPAALTGIGTSPQLTGSLGGGKSPPLAPV